MKQMLFRGDTSVPKAFFKGSRIKKRGKEHKAGVWETIIHAAVKPDCNVDLQFIVSAFWTSLKSLQSGCFWL